MKPIVLVTAFEAFAGRETNTSRRLLDPLLRETPEAVVAEVLPVDFHILRRRIPALLRRHRPLRWLMLGESEGNDALHCERIAVNILEGDLPDNRGKLPPGGRAVRAAPDAYFCTLDPRWIARHLQEASVPAEVSHHAGTFACNLSLFLALHHLQRLCPETEVGFIHVPRRYQRTGLSLPQLRAGLHQLVDDLVTAPAGALRPDHD
ncbi:MAG: pyroglutamyl-peptidase I [Deltaproteobacteria bacterium]|nr:pyroglutamyl-peptidase I [Deltaproteobacteria bacterium]